MFQYFLPDPGTHKGTRQCTHEGCPKTTREGKPYCPKHITDAPYIQDVMLEIAKQDREAEILNQQYGSIPRDGFHARECLFLLRLNSYTDRLLARNLDLSLHAARRLIGMMVRWGYAYSEKGRRGTLIIRGRTPPLFSEPDPD